MKTDGTGDGKEFYFFENASLIESLINASSNEDQYRKIARVFVAKWNWICSTESLGVQFHLPDFLKTYSKEEWEIVIRPKIRNAKKSRVLNGQPALNILKFINTPEFQGWDISSIPKLEKVFKRQAFEFLFQPMAEASLISKPSELDDFLCDLFLYTTNIDLSARCFSNFCSKILI